MGVRTCNSQPLLELLCSHKKLKHGFEDASPDAREAYGVEPNKTSYTLMCLFVINFGRTLDHIYQLLDYL